MYYLWFLNQFICIHIFFFHIILTIIVLQVQIFALILRVCSRFVILGNLVLDNLNICCGYLISERIIFEWDQILRLFVIFYSDDLLFYVCSRERCRNVRRFSLVLCSKAWWKRRMQVVLLKTYCFGIIRIIAYFGGSFDWYRQSWKNLLLILLVVLSQQANLKLIVIDLLQILLMFIFCGCKVLCLFRILCLVRIDFWILVSF